MTKFGVYINENCDMLGKQLVIFGIGVLVVFTSCNSSSISFVDKIEVLNDSINDLRVHVNFEVDDTVSAYVKYWAASKSEHILYSQLSSNALKHSITLVELKGNTIYNFQVVAKNESSRVQSEIGEFTTKPFPINILHLRWDKNEFDALDGYILSQRRLVNGIIYLIDSDGDVVWYNQIPKQPKLSHWTKNNTILVLYGSAGHRNSSGDQIAEYDLYGNELFHLNLSELNVPMEAHHEVRFDENGNIVLLAYENKEFDISNLGGESKQNILGDKVIKMDSNGEILWEWSVFDYINPLEDTSIVKTAEDWSHANSLSIDQDGNYLISFRNFNQVWKVDATSGNVMWRFGSGGDFDLDDGDYFSGQHAFHLNKDGEHMVFDNGRSKRKTRVITYSLNEESMSAETQMMIDLPEDLYSDKMGSAYLMNNDNILVCAPRTNSIVILNKNGVVKAHAKVGIPDPYRAEYVPILYDLEHVEK